jgi:hypothetical protein
LNVVTQAVLFLVFSALKVISFLGKTKEKLQVERSEIPLRGASSHKLQAGRAKG